MISIVPWGRMVQIKMEWDQSPYNLPRRIELNSPWIDCHYILVLSTHPLERRWGSQPRQSGKREHVRHLHRLWQHWLYVVVSVVWMMIVVVGVLVHHGGNEVGWLAVRRWRRNERSGCTWQFHSIRREQDEMKETDLMGFDLVPSHTLCDLHTDHRQTSFVLKLTKGHKIQ